MKVCSGIAVALLGTMIGMAALACGCAAPPTPFGMIESEPDFAGFVTGFEAGAGGAVLGMLLVESHAEKLVRRAIVTVTKDTTIYEHDGEVIRSAHLDTLRAQDQIQVWFTEPVGDSLPVQATARQVLVLGHY